MSEVLNLTLMEFQLMSEAQRSVLKLKVSQTSGIESLEGLRQRLTEYVTVRSFDSIPVSLADLGRRFNRPAKRLGTSVTDTVSTLVESGVLCILERRKQRAVYSEAVFQFQQKIRDQLGSVDDLTLQLINNMLEES